jgi:hypothetical protein
MWEWMYRSTTLALAGGECQLFYPRGKSPGTHWIGGWVDPTAGLDDVEKRNFLTLLGLELDPSVIQPVASHYTDYAILAPMCLAMGT